MEFIDSNCDTVPAESSLGLFRVLTSTSLSGSQSKTPRSFLWFVSETQQWSSDEETILLPTHPNTSEESESSETFKSQLLFFDQDHVLEEMFLVSKILGGF